MIALVLAQWLSMTLAERRPEVIMAGIWESCPEEDGGYTERARDFTLYDKPWFAFHMGERDEFAIFKGEGPTEHFPHDDKRNLLGPAYHYADLPSQTGRHWSIASLGIHLSVAAMPGSHPECYMFNVMIEKDPSPTWAHK